jgi:hypothetical protein
MAACQILSEGLAVGDPELCYPLDAYQPGGNAMRCE